MKRSAQWMDVSYLFCFSPTLTSMPLHILSADLCSGLLAFTTCFLHCKMCRNRKYHGKRTWQNQCSVCFEHKNIRKIQLRTAIWIRQNHLRECSRYCADTLELRLRLECKHKILYEIIWSSSLSMNIFRRNTGHSLVGGQFSTGVFNYCCNCSTTSSMSFSSPGWKMLHKIVHNHCYQRFVQKKFGWGKSGMVPSPGNLDSHEKFLATC